MIGIFKKMIDFSPLAIHLGKIVQTLKSLK